MNSIQCIENKKTSLSKKKKITFSFIMIFFLWLFFDAALYIFLGALQKKHNIFFEFKVPEKHQVEGFAEKYYHPRWGWDIFKEMRGQFGNRKGRNYEIKEVYTIKTFGDSFTYADGVKDNETWQYFIEEWTGWECLNFGVLGFGTDQALLKYKDTPIKTKYTLLAILDENIGRLMCQWWGFYREDGVGIKPKFIVDKDNSIRLMDNPIKNKNDVVKLGDINFLNSLKKDDYWYNYYMSLGGPKKLTWPATYTALKHIKFFINYARIYITHVLSPSYESETTIKKFYHLYDVNSDGLRIMKYIVDEFIKTAKERGERPVIVIFPIVHTVTIYKKFHKKPHQALIDYLRFINCNFIDFTDVLVKEDYLNYYQNRDGHFTVEGNKKVAQVLIAYIKSLN